MSKTSHSKSRYTPYPDSRHWLTRSFYLAAYLYAQGTELVNVEKNSSGNYVFAFRDAPELDELAHEFEYGPDAIVDARKYVQALEELQFQKEEADMNSRPPIIL